VTNSPSINFDARRGLFGLAVVVAGMLMLLGQLGVIPHVHAWQYVGPAVLIVAGLSRLVTPSYEGRRDRGGLWLVAIGVWLLLGNLRIWPLRHSWPLLLVVVGLGIVWKAIGGTGRPEGERR